jgi:hypothetical protein
LKNSLAARRLAKATKGARPRSDMSKAQYILLLGIIGFYALLFVSLFIRACIGYWQARWTIAAKMKSAPRAVARRRSKAWTHAVRHQKLA